MSGTVIEEIAAERRRQITTEEWNTEHDDEHCDGELALAAACYAVPVSTDGNDPHDIPIIMLGERNPRAAFNGWLRWPWDSEWWKPKTRRRDLIRAAALLVAEIERLDRIGGLVPTHRRFP